MHLRCYRTSTAMLALGTFARHTSAFVSPMTRRHACPPRSPSTFASGRALHLLSGAARAAAAARRSSRRSSTAEEEVDPGAVEGTDLRVLRYPHPALRAPNAEFPPEELTGPGCEASKLAREMFLVMYATKGVGLAAPQVGVNKRLMVYNDTGDAKKFTRETIMVNPRIMEFSAGKDVEEEGCLSFPGMGGEVERSKWIKVEALNIRGKRVKKKFTGWEARIFQHEYDHLDGVVYVDRLTEEGRDGVKVRLEELVSEYGEGGAL